MRAAARAAATVPLTALVLAGAAGLAAPALAADGDSGGELSVTTDGVAFDASRLGDERGWLSYAVTAPDGSRLRLLGNAYSPEETADGHLALDVPARGAYRDGWCVTWVHLTGIRDQFADWSGDSPVCTTSPTATPAPTATPTTQPTAEPTPPPVVDVAPSAPDAAPAAPVEPVAAEPEPAAPTPTETPTEAPVESPTQTPSPSAETTTDRPEPSRTPLVTAGERSAPPAPGSTFPTLVVAGVGGLVAAAAGGAILLLRRAG
ncbi:hypothetical protein [Cellulosimicrobium sp. Marseille-Q4280]|uniref:hypothetical protein n=1 Tax=Cellulosimicrobium sp. Marseille-Q4280 TaxID=2937992 RepID=UPI00203D3862|nr:hypothetical protein [Cellulosimicrobium sp. Marseille-Q4280]